MAAATTTTLGEIVLAGDLTGDANFPELRASGVTPGTYTPVQRLSVNSRGLITSAGQLTSLELTNLLPTSTSSVKGVFSIGGGLLATSGAVTIDLSSFAATSSAFGSVASGTNITNTAGVLSVADAASAVKGLFTVGAGFTISVGAATVDTSALAANLTAATSSIFGVVSSGTNIVNTSGTLSVADATNSSKGICSVDTTSGLSVSGAALGITNVAKSTAQNAYTISQNGSTTAGSTSGTITPDFQNGATSTTVALNGNLTINFPTVLAPTGTIVRQDYMITYSAGTAYSVSISGSYKTNATLAFTNAPVAATDLLTLLCTDTVCYTFLTPKFQ